MPILAPGSCIDILIAIHYPYRWGPHGDGDGFAQVPGRHSEGDSGKLSLSPGQKVQAIVYGDRIELIPMRSIKEKLHRLSRSRLARECAKLDPALEKAMAEEGMSEELGRWPEY